MASSELGKFSVVGDPSEEFSVTINYAEPGQVIAEALIPRKTVVTKGLWRSGVSLIGKTQTTAKTTLLWCRVSGVRGGPLEDILVLAPRWIINGLHLGNPEEALARSIELQPRFLGSWFGQTLITTTPDIESGAVAISYPGKLERSYGTREGTFSVGRRADSFTLTFSHQAQSLKEMFWCRLDFAKPKNFDAVLALISALEGFFSFATMQPSKSKHTSIRSSETEIGQLIFGRTSADAAIGDEDAHTEILFGYDDTKDNLGKVVDRWLAAHHKIEACQQLLAFARNPTTTLENRLVALCQGLESFHRKSGHGAYIEKDEYLTKWYPKILAAIPQNIDPALLNALKSRFRYGYEYSLRKRLTDMFTQHAAELASYIRNVGEVVGYAAEERNAYTHLDRDTPPLDAMSVAALCLCLELLLTSCILEEIGFSQEQRKRIFDRNQYYLRYRSRLLASFVVPGS